MAQINHVTPEDLNLQGMDKLGYKGIYQLVIKRGLDILLAVLVLPFVMIVWIPVGILIKIEDGGPVLYKANRIGRSSKPYQMLKFRSMKVNAPSIINDDGSTYNSKDDARVTKIGRFIRETSIDELPQVLNILKGDMSIIGPRPGEASGLGTYTRVEQDKMLVRPGLTGYTQAYYRNGLSAGERRMYDAWYAHNVSPMLDIKIFFKTINTVIKHDNIYTN